MIYSMTGFGKGVASSEDKKFTVEIKSLNGKQMDLFMRVPAAYRESELPMRAAIAESLCRGKVECHPVAAAGCLAHGTCRGDRTGHRGHEQGFDARPGRNK